MTDKISEKILKKPDAFQVFFFRVFNWLRLQQQSLALATIPLILVLGGVGGWQYYNYKMTDQRRIKLAEIERVFSNEEKESNKLKTKIQEEIRKIEKAAEDAKKEADKVLIEAKRKDIEKIAPNHKESIAQFTAFYQANEKNPEGWRAGMAVVENLVKDKKLEDASTILSTIMKHSMGIEFYQVQVRFYAIAILEDLKKYDEALSETEKLLPLASQELTPRVLITKARLQIEAGKKEDAVKTLDTIIASHSSSPEARQAIAIKAL